MQASQLQLSAGAMVSDRYLIRSPLGSGGMGWVFRATDTSLDGQEVALKFLYPHLLSDADSFSRFRNEVLVARRLVHPNIVRTFNMGVDAGHAYIVMEHIDGQTLKAYLREEHPQGIPVEQALTIALDICRGVSHSHSLGIVHRDLKTDNVLVTPEGLAKLSDFGLAATIRRQGNLTRVGQLLGTPYYMSPEQFRGEPPDERSDIYAFGILLFELLFGHVPFNDESLYGLAVKHSTEPLPDIYSSRISPDLWKILLRATEKQPRARFQSCEELVEELEFLSGQERPATTSRAVASIVTSSERIDERPPLNFRRAARYLPLLLALTFAIGVPWVRINESAQSRLVVTFLLTEHHLGIELNPLYRLFGIDPTFKSKPMAELDYGTLWPRIYMGDDPAAPENRQPSNGAYLLHYAVNNNQTDLVKYILDHHSTPNLQDYEGRSPLHIAVEIKDLLTAERLLEAGAPVNVKMKGELTPLHIATAGNNVRMAQTLLRRGADPLLKDANGWSPLMYALEAGRLELISAMLEGVRTDQLSNEDLKQATPRENIDAARALFARRAITPPF